MMKKLVPGEEMILKPDWYVLTDGNSWEIPAMVRTVREPEKVKVFIDHETPCGSEAVAAKQKELIRFAGKYSLDLSNGYGISYQIMLDKYVKSGDVVLCCGDFGSIYASADVLAVKVSTEEMAQAIETGEITWKVPESVSVALTGSLKAPATGKDAVLRLLSEDHGFAGKLLYVSGSEVLGKADRLSFYQLLSASGCAAVLPGSVPGPDALTLDLNEVVPMVSDAENPVCAVPATEAESVVPTAVFVGGCSCGRIEDIRAAAKALKGRKVKRYIRVTVAFATTEVYIQAANEGLITALMEGGAIVMNQGCSACYAHSQGLVDGEDIVLSAGSRVLPNCNGEGNVKTYLCSAATAMESAVAGHVVPAEG